ncbi:hypothetical protein K6U44_17545 [Vibrio parahaemolyticus]|nr:hypothetical protein [Vibrio parahaemolyticus]MCG6462218.1 hypothetical protein [Vibrio parahaemolyticus]
MKKNTTKTKDLSQTHTPMMQACWSKQVTKKTYYEGELLQISSKGNNY